MNKDNYINLLQQPKVLSEEHVSDLASLVSKFPYLQSARSLYLKSLKDQESFKYNKELKTTAAYTSDRSILFDYITSETFNQNEISRQIKQNIEFLKTIEVTDADDISVDKSVSIAYALKQQIKDTEGVLDPNLFEKKNQEQQLSESKLLHIDSENIEESPEDILKIGTPLNFDKNETHSFSEWLKITSFKPIDRSNETKKVAPIDSKLKRIDKFISDNPKISPIQKASKSMQTPMAISEQSSSQDGFMTETLARIYLEQKNYDKAIQSYKILSLKYPEKSGFFADQIKAVKELQDINNLKK
ncbi:hypothetical protein RM697_13145 [Ichthyenterobacterium sp. W332]|uniref:Tetratricopeptide repeat protein n=1 Tax=Microcosmobacter mediterraneus TaxID=3075607 RepID=A0ABU2YN66_9FLAO|nr:hypothetical protein [Ichthyenterobacterium sp. W332]MDT0559599.1 hypothetical protein [Ichthyenterobacterium sp. W332]